MVNLLPSEEAARQVYQVTLRKVTAEMMEDGQSARFFYRAITESKEPSRPRDPIRMLAVKSPESPTATAAAAVSTDDPTDDKLVSTVVVGCTGLSREANQLVSMLVLYRLGLVNVGWMQEMAAEYNNPYFLQKPWDLTPGQNQHLENRPHERLLP